MNKDFKTHSHDIHIEANGFMDKGEGRIEFPRGLVITDNTQQRNGTKYDIASMDIGEYNGKLTADHSWSIQEMIGKTFGITKSKSKVTVDGIQFAIKQSALAQYAYDMFKAGYLTDFSIETYGPWPDEEGIYHDAKLVGLSLVVTGNNKSAQVNELQQIATNSIKEAKDNGLDVSELEKSLACYDNDQIQVDKNSKKEEIKMFKTVKNHKAYAVVLKYKNAAGDEVETTVQPGQSVDVSEDQESAVRDQVDSATEPKTDAEPEKKDDVVTAVSSLIKPLAEKIDKLEKQAFDQAAVEPAFKKSKTAKQSTSELDKVSYKERHGMQINAAWEMLKSHSLEAADQLRTINAFHLEKLQEKGLVENAVTLGDFGNFVISPELITDIQGFRSNFQPLISRLNFQETLSLQMAWLKRNGDVNMQEVEMCDDGANGNLKPITDYSADFNVSNLTEVAGVTPVCNAATRFLAADLLGDIAQGYRTDYDRKRAQLFVARLQQAINSTGNQIAYNKTSNVTALVSWIQTMTLMQEEIMNGTYIFNQQTYGELLGAAIAAGISGPLSNLFTTGDQPLLLGRPYIVVPNELMPSLNTNQTKSFTVEGVAVTIREGVFYTDLSQFKGRTSGGLKYDLSDVAAYEENGTVKSAFQRNELVLRGSFFRGGAIMDEDMVVGMVAAGIS